MLGQLTEVMSMDDVQVLYPKERITLYGINSNFDWTSVGHSLRCGSLGLETSTLNSFAGPSMKILASRNNSSLGRTNGSGTARTVGVCRRKAHQPKCTIFNLRLYQRGSAKCFPPFQFSSFPLFLFLFLLLFSIFFLSKIPPP